MPAWTDRNGRAGGVNSTDAGSAVGSVTLTRFVKKLRQFSELLPGGASAPVSPRPTRFGRRAPAQLLGGDVRHPPVSSQLEAPG